MLRAARITACLCAAASLACASGARVDFDAGHDWSRAASWDWLPQSPERPQHGDASLREQIGGAIERELAQRGLTRSQHPDLLVACKVALSREQVLRTETPAQSFLPSLHAGSPSFEIGTSLERRLHYENAALSLEIFDARTQRLLWHAQLERRVRGSFAKRAGAAVTDLLEGFPPPLRKLLSASREDASGAAVPGMLP